MKKLLLSLVTLLALGSSAHAQRLIGNTTLAGGSTLVASANSTVNLSAATVTFAEGQLSWGVLSGASLAPGAPTQLSQLMLYSSDAAVPVTLASGTGSAGGSLVLTSGDGAANLQVGNIEASGFVQAAGQFIGPSLLLNGTTLLPSSGSPVITLPSTTGTLLLTNGNGSALTSLNASALGSGTVPIARLPVSTDGTLAADLDTAIATQKATKTYVDAETTRAEGAETQLGNTGAPRQLIYFTGSAGMPFSLPAFGVGDGGFAVLVNAHAADNTGSYNLITGGVGCLALYINGSGQFGCASASQNDFGLFPGNITIRDGITDLYEVVESNAAGSITLYRNGAYLSTISIAPGYDFTGAVATLGGDTTGYPIKGYVGLVGYFNYARSAPQVAALAQYGVVDPADIGGSLGSFAYPGSTGSAISYGASDANSTSDWFGSGPVASITAVAGSRTGGAGAYFMRLISNGDSPIDLDGPTAIPAGRRVRLTGWARVAVAANVTIGMSSTQYGQAGLGSYGSIIAVGSPANTWTQFSTTVVSAGGMIVFQLPGSGGAQVLDVDDLQVTILGASVAPDLDERGVGYQWHDVSGEQSDITLLASGAQWLKPATSGAQVVRGTLTWSGTHEAKSLLGQVALPPGAVVRDIVLDPSAASSGTGLTIGTTNSGTYYLGSTTFAAGKKFISASALTHNFPASSASGDCDLLLTPDSANYTGTVGVTVDYSLSTN